MKRLLILLLPLLTLALIGCAPDAAPFADSVDAAVAAAESLDAGADPAPTTVPANTDTDAGTPAGDAGISITNTDPVTDCVGMEPQPQAETLAAEHGVTYDDIMGWFCAGYGFGEIDLAYSLAADSDDHSVADIFAMREDGMGWGQIQQELGVLPGDGDEDDEDDDDPPDDDLCSGAVTQPHAQELADQYGVEYEAIMGWFCEGYGFGEIEHAYSLADEDEDLTVEQIFGMREDGMGWGEIWQEAGVLPGNGPPEDPGPPENPGNGNGPPDETPDNGNGPPDNPGNGNGNGPPDDPGPPENPGNGNGPPENPGGGNGNNGNGNG